MRRATPVLALLLCCGSAARAQPGGGGDEAKSNPPPRTPAGPLGIRLQPKVDPPTVKEVFAKTTAEAIGIQVGDVVKTIDGAPTPTVKALVKAYRGKKRWAGDEITVAVLRGEKAVTLKGPLRAKKSLVGKKAPPWNLKRWVNLPKGEKGPLTVAKLEGKVVVMLAFLSWCPNCHKQALPAYAKLEAAFPDREKVVFVYVQTVYEGFSRNNLKAGLRDLERNKLKGPLAHDPGAPDGRRPVFMSRYKTGGTPWTVVIDAQGIVRYTAATPGLEALKGVITKAGGGTPKESK